MPKKKVNVKKHNRKGYVKEDGTKVKPAKVKEHEREVETKPELEEKDKRRITKGKAKKLFNKRSKTAKDVDLDIKTTELMFAYPNEKWMEDINRMDIWGLDGFEPPTVPRLPKEALPHQVVKYRGKIWKADENGNFITPEFWDRSYFEKKEYDFEKYDSEEMREKFEEQTDKNALWHGDITKNYRKWLKEQIREEEIAEKLNHRHIKNLNQLKEIKNLYNTLDLSDEDRKDIMLECFNDYYESRKAASYENNKLEEWYEGGYIEWLENKIQTAENKIERRRHTKDPERVEQGKETYYSENALPFRLPQIRANLDNKNYWDISTYNIIEFFKANPNRKNKDIVDDLITEFKEGNLVDSDIADPNAQKLREQEEMKKAIEKWKQMDDNVREDVKEYASDLDNENEKDTSNKEEKTDPYLESELSDQDFQAIISSM